MALFLTPELATYIRNASLAGISDADMLASLKSAGWSDALIEAGFQQILAQSIQSHPVLETRELSKTYTASGDDAPVLKDIALRIDKGESVAIVGKSGSGKSTLMHILATLDRPSAGELLIDGRATSGLRQSDLDAMRNQKFGFVFQQFFVNGRSTCLENVTLPLAIMGVSVAERQRRGLAILAEVGLADKASKRAGDLSGGQKQRLCIARALITEPELIFADEPTGNLDSENGRHIVELLFRLQRERGITLVIVTHDADLAALCGRTITIRDGAIA